MVESSFPLSRVGAAAVPNSIFLTRQMMIPLGMPNADSAVPQSPVSGNVPSVPCLARRPVHPAPCRPWCCAFWQSISLSLSWCLGDRDGTPVVVSTRHSSCRNAGRRVLPGGTPTPGTPLVSTQGWPAPSRPTATGCELWCWRLSSSSPSL